MFYILLLLLLSSTPVWYLFGIIIRNPCILNRRLLLGCCFVLFYRIRALYASDTILRLLAFPFDPSMREERGDYIGYTTRVALLWGWCVSLIHGGLYIGWYILCIYIFICAIVLFRKYEELARAMYKTRLAFNTVHDWLKTKIVLIFWESLTHYTLLTAVRPPEHSTTTTTMAKCLSTCSLLLYRNYRTAGLPACLCIAPCLQPKVTRSQTNQIHSHSLTD